MSRLEGLAWALCALALAGLMLFIYGREVEQDAEQLRQARASVTAWKNWAKRNDAAVENERYLRTLEREAFDKYRATQEQRNHEADRLISDLRADNRRLRVPVIVRTPAACSVPGGPAAPGAGDQGHAELTPDAGEFLVRLLQRGDQAIAKHAEVVDRYERLRLACEQHTQPPTTQETTP